MVFVQVSKYCNKLQILLQKNTVDTKCSIWREFITFCTAREYKLKSDMIDKKLAALADCAFNMKNGSGDDYPEYVVKTIWISTAKMLQGRYHRDLGIKLDPFSDVF